VLFASDGQASPTPSQTSARSHAPAEARHSAVLFASAGQVAAVPLQFSARSQTPAEARHSVLADSNAHEIVQQVPGVPFAAPRSQSSPVSTVPLPQTCAYASPAHRQVATHATASATHAGRISRGNLLKLKTLMYEICQQPPAPRPRLLSARRTSPTSRARKPGLGGPNRRSHSPPFRLRIASKKGGRCLHGDVPACPCLPQLRTSCKGKRGKRGTMVKWSSFVRHVAQTAHGVRLAARRAS
jgi:hypothetical protein